MVDLCRKCRHFYEKYEEPSGIGDTVPQKGGSTPKLPPKYMCKLNYRMTKNKDNQIIPYTYNFECINFIAK